MPSLVKRYSKPDTRHGLQVETLGVILIVVLILVIAITRSWHQINWSAH